MKKTPETVVLIDCGYDGIQKLARAVRDKQIYTMVIPFTAPVERVMEEDPAGLVFVGADKGILDGARTLGSEDTGPDGTSRMVPRGHYEN